MTKLGVPREEPWQCPDGLTEEQRHEFWAIVKREGEHWIWCGMSTPVPKMTVSSVSISALRVAWAFRYPKTWIPRRINRNKKLCEIPRCVNPEHLYGITHDSSELTAASGARTEIGGVVVPRVLEAYASLQFGTPVSPRPLRKLMVVNEPETLQTPEGSIAVAPPAGITTYSPNRHDLQNAPELSVELLLDLLFRPDTVLMTFKSGTIWISTPDARVAAEDPKSALLGLMIRSGRHKVQG